MITLGENRMTALTVRNNMESVIILKYTCIFILNSSSELHHLQLNTYNTIFNVVSWNRILLEFFLFLLSHEALLTFYCFTLIFTITL